MFTVEDLLKLYPKTNLKCRYLWRLLKALPLFTKYGLVLRGNPFQSAYDLCVIWQSILAPRVAG